MPPPDPADARPVDALLAARAARGVAWIRERAARLPEGAKVLDLAFEPTSGVSERRDLFAHCEYSFFDLRALLESARRGGVYRIPVADHAFDLVVCTRVFEWALYPELALREVLRTLRGEGAVWVAPPTNAPPADAPPFASPALTFAWYAAAFAKHGLTIGDAFGSDGLFGELCEICVEAAARLPGVDLPPDDRRKLDPLLRYELPRLFSELESKIPLESPRARVLFEARRASSKEGEATAAAAGDAAPPPSTGGAAPDVSVRERIGKRPLKITYLVTSILGVTGGNMTLLNQVEALRRRGHAVSIVTYSPRPTWTKIEAPVVQVPRDQPMASHVPDSDVVVATYFQNAHELPRVAAPVKVYFAQGDQFIFEDRAAFPNPEAEKVRQALQASSRQSYLLPGVRLVANSRNLADAILRVYGARAEAVLPVCTDQTIFRPVGRAAPGSRLRILIVGPDTRGAGIESLVFKGMADIRAALEHVAGSFGNFTAVRVSNTPPEIFQGFPCEYHAAPHDELKTYLFGTADLLVYASHFDSCPRPPQEGMAAGAAVVCTDTPGAKEYCVDDQNCLLVPVKDPPAIAAAILRLARDRALRERLVEGGRKTAAEFPREREWNELEALLYRYVEAAGRA